MAEQTDKVIIEQMFSGHKESERERKKIKQEIMKP